MNRKNPLKTFSEIIKAQEEEKRRLSQDIHDTLSQSLVVLKMDVQRIVQKNGIAKLDGKVILDQIDNIIETTRNISSELRPDILDNLGLIEAIRHFSRNFTQKFQIPVTTYINVEHADFGAHKNLQIFRIIQEALINAGKHSQAEKITLLIFKHGLWCTFLVRDDGIGFNVNTLTDNLPTNHLGMRIIQERAKDIDAELSISSEPNKGSYIRIRVKNRPK